MSKKVYIGSTVIDFPTSGTDANWAEAVDEFVYAVEEQLAGISQPYDVSPHVINIPETGTINLSDAFFPSAQVRSFVLTYSIYKVSTGSGGITIVESGTYTAINKAGIWVDEREFFGDKQTSGDSYHTFSMSGDQVTVTSFALSGGSYDATNSKITYSAKTEPIAV